MVLSKNELNGLTLLIKTFDSSDTTYFFNEVSTVGTSLIMSIVTGFIYSCFLLYILSHFADKVAWMCVLFL